MSPFDLQREAHSEHAALASPRLLNRFASIPRYSQRPTSRSLVWTAPDSPSIRSPERAEAMRSPRQRSNPPVRAWDSGRRAKTVSRCHNHTTRNEL
jgi:hypothetical protein